MAKSDVDFAQSVLENAHISIVFLGHLSFLPACAAILDFKNGHGSSLGFSIGVGDLCLLYLCLELVGHFEKKQQQKRREFIDIPLASVTYGKYATRVPDVVAYEFYECFSQ